jgi:5-methylthioribose kinase
MTFFDVQTSLEKLYTYLKDEVLFLEDNEVVERTEIPGEGNMNVVLRVQTNLRSIILKQTRPYLNKFPNISAPIKRIEVENEFYKLMNGSSFFPKVLKYVPLDHILILEDLGDCKNMTYLYQTREIPNLLIQNYSLRLHHIHKQVAPSNYPTNMGLRKLNHKHIFVLPFIKNNSFSLDTFQHGLEALATPIKKNNFLKKKIEYSGKLYLEKGNTLLHGDYYPGSWMQDGNRSYIIDPEFSFVGPKEFDLGVMAAHLIISNGKKNIVEQICNAYPGTKSVKKVQNFCGIEIMRRLIGLAQLPLERSLDEKEQLLILAEEFILS